MHHLFANLSGDDVDCFEVISGRDEPEDKYLPIGETNDFGYLIKPVSGLPAGKYNAIYSFEYYSQQPFEGANISLTAIPKPSISGDKVFEFIDSDIT